MRALAAAAVLFALAAHAPARAEAPETSNFDARGASHAAVPADTIKARAALRRQLGRYGAVSADASTGVLRSVGRLDGFLTGPSARPGDEVALDYVREHADAFGVEASDLAELRLQRRTSRDAVEHFTWEQRVRGLPVADAVLKASVTASGRLIAVTGPPAADVDLRSTEPRLTATEAYAAARRSGGDPSGGAAATDRAADAERTTRFEDGGRASLALYRGDAGYRLAWRLLAPVSSAGVYDVLVDARSGEVVRRVNRVKNAVAASVFQYHPDRAAQVTVDFAPWLTSSTRLEGPNVHAFVDEDDAVGPRPGGYQLTPPAQGEVAPKLDGSYQYAPVAFSSVAGDNCPETTLTFPTSACTWNPLTADSWRNNAAQSATQLFYLVNVFHDYLASTPEIGFTDAGFEMTGKPLGDPNTGAASDASDPVLAQALDGADLNAGLPDDDHQSNASFLALPDGYPGLMQIHLWAPPSGGGYDAANDAGLVFHEYTHGLSERLVTDGAGFGALNTRQAAAMAEGWSDFYALDYLVDAGLEPDAAGSADVRLGEYVDGSVVNATLRTRVQSIDCLPGAAHTSACLSAPGAAGAGGFTYADFGRIAASGPEPHADGEIWAQTLWQVRTALGDVKARRYVTQAMRLSPPEPTFLDMRNAILEASSTPADDAALWTVFAQRGMGYFAATDGGDDAAPVADFTDPQSLTGSATISGGVRDEDGRGVAGATVGVAGYDGGLGPQHAATTGGDGAYALTLPAGATHSYPPIRARKPGFTVDSETGVQLADDDVLALDFQLERDWSSAAGGAAIRAFTGPDHTADGCGPGGLIDDTGTTVWGSRNTSGGQSILIDLGAPIDVGRVAIDPAAGCGDDATAGLGGYELLGATGPDGPFTAIGAPGTFSPSDNGKLTTAFSGTLPQVRYVALRTLSSQSNAPGGSGATFIDVAEIHVAKTPLSAVGPAVETGGAHGTGPSTATVTGTVTTHAAPAEVVIEYGATSAYGHAAPAATLPAGGPATAVAGAVGALAPSTTYHARVVAVSNGRSYPGKDVSFTTPAAPPEPTPTPTPEPTSTPTPDPTVLRDGSLRASRKGMLKVRVAFGDAAAAGTARLTLRVGKRRYATALLAVRPGRTVVKTLRLNKAARKRIKPGGSRKVRLELRLPDGQKLAKTVRLSRTRR